MKNTAPIQLDIDIFKKYLQYNSYTGFLMWIKNPSIQHPFTGKVAGGLNSRGYIEIGFKGRIYKAHRLAWLLYYGDWPKNQIDHINGTKHDNRIENLREVSSRQNCQNRDLHRKGRLFGCHFNKQRNKWQARIKINGKTKHLGLFNTEQEAHEAYKKGVINVTN